MGSEVTAECKCGLKVRIPTGGGMRDFMSTCYFPCLCENCNRIVQVNLLAGPLRCPKCEAPNPTPYDKRPLIESPGQHVVAEWNVTDQLGRELSLSDGKYQRPECKWMMLPFGFGASVLFTLF